MKLPMAELFALEGIRHALPLRSKLQSPVTDFTEVFSHTTPVREQAVSPVKSTPYRVRSGDTLSHICLKSFHNNKIGTSSAQLYEAVQRIANANGLRNPDSIYPGQQLDLSALNDLGPRAEALPDFRFGETAPANTGLPIESPRVESKLLEAPAPPLGFQPWRGEPVVQTPARVQGATRLVASPKVREVAPGHAHAHPVELAAAVSGKEIASPWTALLREEGHLTSEFGQRRDPFTGRMEFHTGIDLAAQRGTPIYPFTEGEVTFSGWRVGYGNLVEVTHPSGLVTLYGHNARNLVKRGDTVTGETALAKVGSSGRSTGPHVHFEVLIDGQAVDPIPYLEGAAATQLAQAR